MTVILNGAAGFIVMHTAMALLDDGETRNPQSDSFDPINPLACLNRPPSTKGLPGPHQVYNLGNYQQASLTDFIGVIEKALGKKAKVDLLPMQPGDVKETCAEIDKSRRDLGFEPKNPIADGIVKLID